MSFDLTKVNPADLSALSDDDLTGLISEALTVQKNDVKENQIAYYEPVSEKARAIHLNTKATTIGIGGGNGSSKTETSFAEMVMCSTGIFPDWIFEKLTEEEIRQKAPGPMECRVILASFNTMIDKMLKKFKWWEWTGVPPQGGERGHWGWIPRKALHDGSWDKSWMAGKSTLEFDCVDPFNPDKVVGQSRIQFMSSNMDALSMAGVDLQFCVMDEPSTLSIYNEIQARLMRGDGRLFLPMTWQDDAGIEVDWIYEKVYDPGMDESNTDFAWYVLSSFDNPHLPQDRVAKRAMHMTAEERRIRLEGDNLRFSNLIHPLFNERGKVWCFECNEGLGEETFISTSETGTQVCSRCKSDNIVAFSHLQEFEVNPSWPTVFIIDPHPRKPHMFQWVQIDPNDDLWQIADGEIASEPLGVAEMVARIEDNLGLYVTQRLMDPNMGLSQSQPGRNREITWQMEFNSVGICCELADNSAVGRARLNEYLKPDPWTRVPRFHIHPRCENTIKQMKSYVWDNFKQDLGKDIKQVPKAKNDDYPNNLKYLVNSDPKFSFLREGAQILHTRIHKGKKDGHRNRM